MNEFLNKEYLNLINTEPIDNNDYDKYSVKRGLRNKNGTGVLVGLTRVADVVGYYIKNGKKMPSVGKLYYRGFNISEVVNKSNNDFGFENTCFLLLFGHYPNNEESKQFKNIIKSQYNLPEGFLENIILKNPSKSLINHITRAVLSLYSFDDNPDDIDPYSLLNKSLYLISKMPAIVSYSLQAKRHYIDHESLNIHFPKEEYSIAENILYMSRNDGKFTDLEAKTLDKCLIVHADHGGGNNSTFTGTVVASTLTDIYSMVAASMTSLKGPRHGGANIKVLQMMDAIIDDIGIDASDKQIIEVINKILNKQYFDNSGLLYGIGHAVYTISDPRCELLREQAKILAKSKNNKKYDFYERFEKLAIKTLNKNKNMVCCANVDYYSGLIYEMLDIPQDLFVPLFATARLVGWLSHDIENILYSKKIVRPATKYVGEYYKESK